MAIPGLDTLYAIFKRDIDRTNSILSKRMELSNELRENAGSWITYLMSAFEEAIELYKRSGKQAAIGRVQEQIDDFMKLDYHSLRSDSQILCYLDDDTRFSDFVEACVEFYSSALDIKRLVYAGIENADGENLNLVENDIEEVISMYHSELERMHRELVYSHNQLKIIEPK